MKIIVFSVTINGMFSRNQLICCAVLLLACIPQWPEAEPAANAADPVYAYFTLDNGLQVLLQEKHDLPLTGITLAINLGIKDETEENSGYTHVLEHMLLFGSSSEASGDARLAEFRSHACGIRSAGRVGARSLPGRGAGKRRDLALLSALRA